MSDKENKGNILDPIETDFEGYSEILEDARGEIEAHLIKAIHALGELLETMPYTCDEEMASVMKAFREASLALVRTHEARNLRKYWVQE